MVGMCVCAPPPLPSRLLQVPNATTKLVNLNQLVPKVQAKIFGYLNA